MKDDFAFPSRMDQNMGFWPLMTDVIRSCCRTSAQLQNLQLKQVSLQIAQKPLRMEMSYLTQFQSVSSVQRGAHHSISFLAQPLGTQHSYFQPKIICLVLRCGVIFARLSSSFDSTLCTRQGSLLSTIFSSESKMFKGIGTGLKGAVFIPQYEGIKRFSKAHPMAAKTIIIIIIESQIAKKSQVVSQSAPEKRVRLDCSEQVRSNSLLAKTHLIYFAIELEIKFIPQNPFAHCALEVKSEGVVVPVVVPVLLKHFGARRTIPAVRQLDLESDFPLVLVKLRHRLHFHLLVVGLPLEELTIIFLLPSKNRQDF